MARPVVEAKGVGVRYGHEDVVEDASFAIETGEFVGIVGPNGGGKSTLLRALLGLMPVHRGELRLWGEEPRHFRSWERIGYVPQHAVHLDVRNFPATVFEVALLGRAARRGVFRRFTAQDKARTREALRRVGMDGQADRRIGELSGGQRQRAFLAKALAGEPELLVLDEPTTGVDPAGRKGFLELVDHLNHEEGVTVVLVSHDTPSLVLSAHRILAMNKRLVYDGPPAGMDRGLGPVYDMELTHVHAEDEEHAARP